MDEKDYHSHPALSQSKLKVLSDNPRKFYQKYIEKIEVEESDNTVSKQLGTCWDLALTDYPAYLKLKVKDTKTTKVEGCITENWKQTIDKGMLRLRNYQMQLTEFKAGDSYRTLGQLFDNCEKQEILFWKDPKTGEECRGKLDFRFYSDSTGNKMCFIIDLKSTKAETLEEFTRDFIKYKYYLQAAMYCTGKRIKHNLSYYPPFYFAAISTITGEVFTIKVSEQMLAMGLIEMDGLIAKYQSLKLTNDWNIDNPPLIMDLPDWKVQQIINTYSIGVAA